MLKKHHHLNAHHRYQLEVIFLFVTGFFLFFPYYLLIDEYRLNMLDWQWFFFWPWIVFYVVYSLAIRKRIKKSERVSPLKRPIGHWVILGVILILLHIEPTKLENLQSLDLMFGVFTLFLADSYWAFRKK